MILSVGDVCRSVLTVTLSDGGVLPSLGGEQSEGGRRITLTQITNQPWCRKKEMSPWQRKPPASVMWNWCWSLSRRSAHAVHLHAEWPAPHHVAARRVLTAILSHGGKIWGLSQAQPWHQGLDRSQVRTHTGAQYGCNHVPPWICTVTCKLGRFCHGSDCGPSLKLEQ